jgi:hypothetical protein
MEVLLFEIKFSIADQQLYPEYLIGRFTYAKIVKTNYKKNYQAVRPGNSL